MVAVKLRMFADALANTLQQSDGIEVVQHGVMGGAEAVEAFQRTNPDLALLDYLLSGMDGPEATGAIRAASPTAKVLLLSGTYGPDHIERALNFGAVGFLPMSLSPDEVVDAIRQAHRGRPLIYADELAKFVDELNARIQLGDELYARYETLTDHELEILRQLGEGQTTSQVARSLSISPGTLKNQLTRIYAKTGARNRIEVVDIARNTGVLPERGRRGG